LGIAAGLPGRALHVALAALHEVKMSSSDSAKLTAAALARFGVRGKTGSRGLAKLESAGLVTVERRRGRAPRVTIREFVTGDSTATPKTAKKPI